MDDEMEGEEVREFLMRWLLELGSDWVNPYQNEWYRRHPTYASNPALRYYFNIDHMNKIRINQKGLDFIKGESRA